MRPKPIRKVVERGTPKIIMMLPCIIEGYGGFFMAEFEYDRRSLRYRWKTGKRKGQFVSQAKVEALVQKHVAKVKDEAIAIGQRLIDGKITVPEWETEVAKRLKSAHVAEYALGKPGELSSSDYGRIGAQLRMQYQRLRMFSDQIVSGNLSKQQIVYRTQLYFGKIRESYWGGRRAINRENGAMWEKRLLAIADHCASCPVYSGMGWQPIGTLPLPTNLCECRSNCKCSMIYSTSITRPG